MDENSRSRFPKLKFYLFIYLFPLFYFISERRGGVQVYKENRRNAQTAFLAYKARPCKLIEARSTNYDRILSSSNAAKQFHYRHLVIESHPFSRQSLIYLTMGTLYTSPKNLCVMTNELNNVLSS